MIKTETEIIVPDTISLKSEATQRVIRLEECQSQNEVIEYLKLCLSLSSVYFSEKTKDEFGKASILWTANHSKKIWRNE